MRKCGTFSGETEPNKEGLDEDIWKDEEEENEELDKAGIIFLCSNLATTDYTLQIFKFPALASNLSWPRHSRRGLEQPGHNSRVSL